MSDLSRITLPHFQKERRPERHESGEKDGGVVVEEIGGARVETRFAQLPVIAAQFAGIVTNGTHRHVEPPQTDILTGDVRRQCHHTVQEAQQSHH